MQFQFAAGEAGRPKSARETWQKVEEFQTCIFVLFSVESSYLILLGLMHDTIHRIFSIWKLTQILYPEDLMGTL